MAIDWKSRKASLRDAVARATSWTSSCATRVAEKIHDHAPLLILVFGLIGVGTVLRGLFGWTWMCIIMAFVLAGVLFFTHKKVLAKALAILAFGAATITAALSAYPKTAAFRAKLASPIVATSAPTPTPQTTVVAPSKPSAATPLVPSSAGSNNNSPAGTQGNSSLTADAPQVQSYLQGQGQKNGGSTNSGSVIAKANPLPTPPGKDHGFGWAPDLGTPLDGSNPPSDESEATGNSSPPAAHDQLAESSSSLPSGAVQGIAALIADGESAVPEIEGCLQTGALVTCHGSVALVGPKITRSTRVHLGDDANGFGVAADGESRNFEVWNFGGSIKFDSGGPTEWMFADQKASFTFRFETVDPDVRTVNFNIKLCDPGDHCQTQPLNGIPVHHPHLNNG